MTTRRAGSRQSASTTTKPIRSTYGAEDGLAQMKKESQRADARREAQKQRANEPRRFWMKEGETRELIIVDDKLSFFRYEHALQDPKSKRFDNFVPCIDEHANCPICKMPDSKQAYFAAYLTVIDTTPYENNEGDTIPWSKRLLVIKPAQQKKYARLQEREGSLRGMVIEVIRDKKTDASIGNDVEFIEFLEEDDLLEYETVYTDKDGKDHDIIGHEPFDYEEAFPDWTEKQLQSVAGGGSSTTPTRSSSRRGRDEEEEEEEQPRRASRDSSRAGSKDSAKPAGRSASRRASREEEPEEEEEQEEEPRRRGSSSRSSAPAARSTSRRAAREEPEEEEEEEGPPFDTDEEEEQEEPPRRSGRANAPRTTSRRAAREEEPEEEPRPQRKPAGRGGVDRSSLRRNGR